VGSGKLGKLFELPVEGHVYAQPLYVEQVDVPVLQQHIELILPVGLVDQVVAGVVE